VWNAGWRRFQRCVVLTNNTPPCAGIPRAAVVDAARRLASTAQVPSKDVKGWTPSQVALYEKVRPSSSGHTGSRVTGVSACCQALQAVASDDRDSLHPVRMGGGVLFSDGSMETTWQSKALEFVDRGYTYAHGAALLMFVVCFASVPGTAPRLAFSRSCCIASRHDAVKAWKWSCCFRCVAFVGAGRPVWVVTFVRLPGGPVWRASLSERSRPSAVVRRWFPESPCCSTLQDIGRRRRLAADTNSSGFVGAADPGTGGHAVGISRAHDKYTNTQCATNPVCHVNCPSVCDGSCHTLAIACCVGV